MAAATALDTELDDPDDDKRIDSHGPTRSFFTIRRSP